MVNRCGLHWRDWVRTGRIDRLSDTTYLRRLARTQFHCEMKRRRQTRQREKSEKRLWLDAIPEKISGGDSNPDSYAKALRIWHHCENRVESPASTTVRRVLIHWSS